MSWGSGCGSLTEIGGLVALVTAALATVPLEETTTGALALAAICRTYRLTRAGPTVLDRLVVALALVPACALLTGGLALIAVDEFDLERAGVYLLAGALALVVGPGWWRVAVTRARRARGGWGRSTLARFVRTVRAWRSWMPGAVLTGPLIPAARPLRWTRAPLAVLRHRISRAERPW